ncbi:uncharacterized protein KZ484_026278 isoform 2-T2 [Pholidichthys leucotaenia]
MEPEQVKEELLEPEQIKEEQVESETVKEEQIEPEQIEEELMEPEHIKEEGVESEHIKEEQIEPEQINEELMEPEHIKEEQVEPEHIKEEQVESEHIKEQLMEPEHIKEDQVEPEHMKEEQVEPEQIKEEQVEPKQVQQELIEPEKIKEEWVEPEHIKEELSISQEREHVQKVETETIMAACIHEENDTIEPEPNCEQLFSQNLVIFEIPAEERRQHEDSEFPKSEEPKPKKARLNDRSHCRGSDNALLPKTLRNLKTKFEAVVLHQLRQHGVTQQLKVKLHRIVFIEPQLLHPVGLSQTRPVIGLKVHWASHEGHSLAEIPEAREAEQNL